MLLSSQYIRNAETSKAGEFRKSVEGRVEFRRTKSVTNAREARAASVKDLEKLQEKHDDDHANEAHVENLMKEHNEPTVDVESVYPETEEAVEGKQD